MSAPKLIWPVDPVLEYPGRYGTDSLFSAISQAGLSDCVMVLFNDRLPKSIMSLAAAPESVAIMLSELPAPIVGGCPRVAIEATPSKITQLIEATNSLAGPEFISSLFVVSSLGEIWLDASDMPFDPFQVPRNAPASLIESLTRMVGNPSLAYQVYGP